MDKDDGQWPLCSECGEEPCTDVDGLCDYCGDQFAMQGTTTPESQHG